MGVADSLSEFYNIMNYRDYIFLDLSAAHIEREREREILKS